MLTFSIYSAHEFITFVLQGSYTLGQAKTKGDLEMKKEFIHAGLILGSAIAALWMIFGSLLTHYWNLV